MVYLGGTVASRGARKLNDQRRRPLVHEALVSYGFEGLEALDLFAQGEVVATGAARHGSGFVFSLARTRELSQALASPAQACLPREALPASGVSRAVFTGFFAAEPCVPGS